MKHVGTQEDTSTANTNHRQIPFHINHSQVAFQNEPSNEAVRIVLWEKASVKHIDPYMQLATSGYRHRYIATPRKEVY